MRRIAQAKLAFDTGGTFTDFALLDDEGAVHVHKVLSTPKDPAEAVLRGIDELLDRLGNRVARQNLRVFGATTLVTNAVLERKGARTAFITTKGFRDILRIRTESRYDLYDLKAAYPMPIVPRDSCFGVAERMAADGTVITPLEEDEVLSVIRKIREADIESVAVCLLHSYKFPVHEHRIGNLLAEQAPSLFVSLSSSVCPEMREYDRASTTVVNAYTQPLMRRHVAHLAKELRVRGLGEQLFFMTSSGGIIPRETVEAFPVRLIESGPAAGALAAAEYGLMTGENNVLSFDMGGTTAKLCVVRNGRPTVGADVEVAREERFKRGSGFPLKIHSIHLIEIGAGGGSIAGVDQLGLLRIGPQSAGAHPGPACYGAGGTQPTVTDADLLLGYVDADSFLGGHFKLSRDAATAAITDLAGKLGVSRDRCAWGIHDLVNENMSKAAAVHAIESGIQIRNFTLVAFGGAGPVHAYGVARKLGIQKIICPLGAGVTSAIGLLVAPVAVDLAVSLPIGMDQWSPAAIKDLLAGLVKRGQEVVRSAGVPPQDVSFMHTVDMRHVGQGHEITVPLPSLGFPEEEFRQRLLDAFYATYETLYGRRVAGSNIEAITWRLRVAGPKDRLVGNVARTGRAVAWGALEKGMRPAYLPELGGFVEAPVYSHYTLRPGTEIKGPAIVEQRESTVLVGPRATATIDTHQNLVIHLN